MKLTVESDGDRHPKDVYLVNDQGGRVATMEFNGSEDAMFKLARLISSRFNNPGRVVYRKAKLDPETTICEDGDVYHPTCRKCGSRSTDCGCD